MHQLHLEAVSFGHPGIPALFSNLTAHLEVGWTGLVGANGAGKTTLLRLLAGELEPQEGRILRSPQPFAWHMCPQRSDVVTEAMESFAHTWDNDAIRLRSLLDIEFEQFTRWETLSCGQQKRWQVATALWHRPNLLLLDEPTNHLDSESQRLLLQALQEFKGLGLCVSHDRAFLDDLTTQTWRLEDGVFEAQRAAFSEAHAIWERAREARIHAHEAIKERLGKAQETLATHKQRTHQAREAFRHQQRTASHKDHDAHSMVVRGRSHKADARASQTTGMFQSKLARLAAREEELRTTSRPGRSLFVDFTPAFKPVLAALDDEPLVVGDTTLLESVSLFLGRDSRVHLEGANGVGKTTLLEALLEHATIPKERLLYVPQELTDELIRAAHDGLFALPPDERGRVLQIVAALGLDPSQLLHSPSWSPGEARKLMLAQGLARNVWAVFLDEPTNHLDLPSIQRLEEALSTYPGALLLISHDEAFAASCTHQSWLIREGQLWLTEYAA